MGPQTCWKFCGTLPWRSWTLSIAPKFRGRSCAVPAGPIWEKQTSLGASFYKLGCDVWPVRWDAVFFSPMLRAIARAVSLTTFDNIEWPKMWNRQLQMVGLTKVTCKRSGNKLPSFYPHRPLLITPGASTMTVPMGPQTCWKSCATLPWRSWTSSIALKFRPLRGRSCAAPAGAIWEKQTSNGAWSCKFSCDVWPVRWDAVFFSPILRPIARAVSLTTFGTIERPNMWNSQLEMVGHAKVTRKRNGNRLPSFDHHSPLLITPGALAMPPKVPMGPQICWKSYATLPWRSWTLVFAIKFRPVRGSEFPVVRGLHWVMHPASQRRSCQGLFLEAQPTEVSGVGGWSLHQILGGQVSHE